MVADLIVLHKYVANDLDVMSTAIIYAQFERVFYCNLYQILFMNKKYFVFEKRFIGPLFFKLNACGIESSLLILFRPSDVQKSSLIYIINVYIYLFIQFIHLYRNNIDFYFSCCIPECGYFYLISSTQYCDLGFRVTVYFT